MTDRGEVSTLPGTGGSEDRTPEPDGGGIRPVIRCVWQGWGLIVRSDASKKAGHEPRRGPALGYYDALQTACRIVSAVGYRVYPLN